jgi:hypothetical protein
VDDCYSLTAANLDKTPEIITLWGWKIEQICGIIKTQTRKVCPQQSPLSERNSMSTGEDGHPWRRMFFRIPRDKGVCTARKNCLSGMQKLKSRRDSMESRRDFMES